MAIVDRIKWYPIILVACYTVPFIHRSVFNLLIDPSHIRRGLELRFDEFRHHHLIVIVGSVTLKLQGFFDALAYSATPQVLKRWRTWLRSSLIPTIEWASFSSSRTSQRGAISSEKLLFGSPSSTSSPKVKNEISLSSNSNSKGSSYFSYAQEESEVQ